MFKDAWNPTQEEIKAWAYSDEYAPEQDFELAVNEIGNIPMICGFIDDPSCPKKRFFLSSLYVFTGDIIRINQESPKTALLALLDQLSKEEHSDPVRDWIARSLELADHPRTYSYEYWGMGSQYVYAKTEGEK